jgi:flagellar protein FlgJ
MSIFPTNDLISDVGRAALPSRKSEALHKLERFSFSGGRVTSTPNTTITTQDFRDIYTSRHVLPSKSSMVLNVDCPDKNDSSAVFRKFEAFILHTWLELLLPKVDSGAFGSDHAGGLWRSLVAEQLGEQLGKTGALGLARLAEHGVYQTKESPSHSRFDLIEESNPSGGLSHYQPKSPVS